MSKTRLTDRWLFLALTAILFAVVVGALVVLTKEVGADEFALGIAAGDIYPMYAACDARGANEVAKANLATGMNEAGNVEFNRQMVLRPPHCFAWGFLVPLKVEVVTYVGMNRGLHVLIVKFSDNIYSVVTGTHTAPSDPDPGPGLAGFQV